MPKSPAIPAEFHVIDDTIVGPGPIHLPTDCVQCGEPAEQGKRTEKDFYWAPSWVWLCILVNLLVLLIVYMVVRKPVNLGFSQCRQCHGRKTRWMWAFGACVIGSIALIIVGANGSSATPVFVGIGVFIMGIVFAVLAQPPVKIKTYNEPNFVIAGVNSGLLERLEGGYSESGRSDCRSCGEPLRSDADRCPVCGTTVWA